MGLPCTMKMKAEDQGDGHEHVDHRPPHVHEIVAELGIAAKGPDDGHQRAEADGGREEEVADAEEDLAEVRQVLVPGIVLQVGVRHEGDHAVKDGGGGQHALAVGVQRHPGLEGQHQIAEDEEHGS